MRKPRTPEVLRKPAAQILRKCKIAEPPVEVDKIAELLGAQVRYSPFEGELAGMLVRSGKQVIIGVNSLHHTNRQRFTIAHECGHYLLHKGEDVHIDRTFQVNKRDEVSSLAVDADEIEANRFAAELLMPFDMIMADLRERPIDVENEQDLKQLAQRYQVSVQAMTHRITNLLDYL
jgi:Zn-dependent peptidase ImmA (M78 family)